HFALLTDFGDAQQESTDDDEKLVELAKKGIAELNDRHAGGRGDLFFLFHRPRVWNDREDAWMGHERKRGKLADFNAFLTTGRREPFSTIAGNTQPLASVRYVITLDTDTQLPRDSAHQLIGAMSHPLNRPRFDEETGCVPRGYVILQPRVA